MNSLAIKQEAAEDYENDYMEFIPEIVLKEDHEDHSVLVKEALVQSDSEDEENDDFDPFSGEPKQINVEANKKVVDKEKAKVKRKPQAAATKPSVKSPLKNKKSTIDKFEENESDLDFDSDDNKPLSRIKTDVSEGHKSEEDDNEEVDNEEYVSPKENSSKIRKQITKDLKYICMSSECKNDVFENPFEFVDHMEVVHNKTLSVAKIKYSVPKEDKAKPIIKIHPRKVPDLVVCEKCNKQYSSTDGLRRHSEKNKCTRRNYFICKICHKDMKRSDLRILHIKLEHPGEGAAEFLKCLMCAEKFETKQEIADHYTTIHDNNFSCQHCPKTFQLARLLLVHNRQQHRRLGLICDDCGKVCRSVKELHDHKQVHNKEANIKCTECDLMFTSEVKMTYHFNSVHNAGEFTCEICSKTFITRLKLSHHKYEKHKEKIFQCHVCAKNFIRNEELVRHVLWHEGLYTYKKKKSKPKRRDITYSCTICDMKTVFRDSMRQHMKFVHTGEKRRYRKNAQTYFCEICNRYFSENRYYKKHMSRQSVHMMHRCEICHMEILGIVNFRSHKTVHSKKTVLCQPST